jgi:hypothetical protein
MVLGLLLLAMFGYSTALAQSCPELKNILSVSVPDSVTACPAGDSVLAGHPSRVRMVVSYTGPPCNAPRVGVPPESIWVQTTRVSGTVKVWDQPLKIFADDSTDANGYARITLPSVSGCGTLRLAAYVDGIREDSVTVVVRSVDTDTSGVVTSADGTGACDLDYDGDVGVEEASLISQHSSHWHRDALFGTPVRRTNLCDTCTTEDPVGGLGDSELSWSPSGKYLAHTVFVPEQSHPTLGDCHVFLTTTNPRDGNVSRHFTFPPDSVHDYDPSWSPLGTEIAFDRGDHALFRKGIPGIAADTTEHLVTSFAVTLLLRGANMPSISPNGQWIAYVLKRRNGHQDLGLVSPADTTVKDSLTTNINAFYPQWSPDGR